jgi:hypothetical protein
MEPEQRLHFDLPPFFAPYHQTGMVDYHAEKSAHKSEGCPACKGTMNLAGDTYTCDKCGHFRQNSLLQSLIERQDRENLRFCKREYCLKERNGASALD